MDSVAAFLGLIRKAGKVEIGEEPVGSACRNRKAKLVLTASDAAENSVRRASHFADIGKAPVLSINMEKGSLGQAVGRPPCSMIAITDVGFASALVKKMAKSNPDLDATVCDALDVKSQKALQRQKEKRAHEKKLLRTKQKPWAAPDTTGKKRDK